MVVPDEPVFELLAAEHGNIKIVIFLSDRKGILLISEGSAAQERFNAINVASSPGSEVHHAPECVVVVER